MCNAAACRVIWGVPSASSGKALKRLRTVRRSLGRGRAAFHVQDSVQQFLVLGVWSRYVCQPVGAAGGREPVLLSR